MRSTIGTFRREYNKYEEKNILYNRTIYYTNDNFYDT